MENIWSDPTRPRRLRAVLWECCEGSEGTLAERLAREGVQVDALSAPEDIVERALHDPPDFIVYEVGTCDLDRGLLQLLRRVVPGMPLVITAERGSLELRRRALEFRPIFFAVHPVSHAELRQILRAVSDARRVAPAPNEP